VNAEVRLSAMRLLKVFVMIVFVCVYMCVFVFVFVFVNTVVYYWLVGSRSKRNERMEEYVM
jgi:hypothetical protein